MHIAIDISPIHNKNSTRGVGLYTKLLVNSLKQYKTEHTYSFFVRGQKIPNNTDIIHYPYFDPFFLTLPFYSRFPTVVTVHDLIPIAHAAHFSIGIRGRFKWYLQRHSLQGINRILTDSFASKSDIEMFGKIDSKKIDVVYLAPSKSFSRVTNKIVFDSVRRRFHIQDKFILYVGDVNWNKNVPGLLRAFSKFLDNQRNELDRYSLVLVGKSFLSCDLTESSYIDSLITDMHLKDKVLRIGYVSDDDLRALYSMASVYVHISFAEGFGLPILEAMACGCPIVTSNRSSLAEIAGPSLQVDPDSTSDIAKGISKMIHSDLKDLQNRYNAWLSHFSWKQVANKTVESYIKTLQTH